MNSGPKMHGFGCTLCFSFPQCTKRVSHKKFRFIGILLVSSLTPVFVPFFVNIVLQLTRLRTEASLAHVISLPLADGYIDKPVAAHGVN